MQNEDLAKLLAVVREKRPLVHHITNYVTVNDCANITLCIGGSPVMADAKQEVAEMVSLAGALVLNIGTLNEVQIESMVIAGRRANEIGVPVVLDPVGAGATKYRTATIHRLLDEVRVSVIKGNAGEIGVMAGTGGIVRGVDSVGAKGDLVNVARDFASFSGAVVVISGATDVVSDGQRTYLVRNGHEMMGRLSGTGCMATSVTAAFAAISQDRVLSSVAALAAFGIAGERAAARASGPFAFKMALFDETAAMTPDDVLSGAKVKQV